MGSRSRRAAPLAVVGVVLAAAAAALGLTGCASLSPDAGAAASVVSQLDTAIASGDGAAACALLSESAQRSVTLQTGGGCADGILSLGLAVDATPGEPQAYGRSAFVPLGDGAVFLTADDDGWRVRAIGCVPQGDSPYLCAVDGS